MKKIGLILFALTLSACASGFGEEKFANPIFYKIMEPLSSGEWYTQLTPTEMVSSDNNGNMLRQKCSLIENTMEAVTLKCDVPYPDAVTKYVKNPTPDDYISIYRFVLEPDEKDFHGMVVGLYELPGDVSEFSSYSAFVINDDEP